MKRKLKLLWYVIVLIFFVGSCYFIYEMKDNEEVVEKKTNKDTEISELITVEQWLLDPDVEQLKVYYIEIDIDEKTATLFHQMERSEEQVIEAEPVIQIYKLGTNLLSIDKVEEIQKLLEKINNKPSRYYELDASTRKKESTPKDSLYYYVLITSTDKVGIYFEEEKNILEPLFEQQ